MSRLMMETYIILPFNFVKYDTIRSVLVYVVHSIVVNFPRYFHCIFIARGV